MPPDDAASRQDVDRLSKSVEELTKTIKELPALMAALYVHQDVYAKDQIIHDLIHAAQKEDIKGLQKSIAVAVGFVLAGVGGALLKLVLG